MKKITYIILSVCTILMLLVIGAYPIDEKGMGIAHVYVYDDSNVIVHLFLLFYGINAIILMFLSSNKKGLILPVVINIIIYFKLNEYIIQYYNYIEIILGN